MGENIDEVLGAMTADELKALEAEIDKTAEESSVTYWLSLGAKLARESVKHFEKSGELTPALHLAREAATPLNEKIALAFVEATQGKKTWGDVQKVAQDEVGEKAMVEIGRVVDKASAEELAWLDKAIDEERETKEAQAIFDRYHEMGKKMAQDFVAASRGEKTAGPAGAAISGVISKLMPKARALGQSAMGFAKKHPLATGVGLGAAGTLATQKLVS